MDLSAVFDLGSTPPPTNITVLIITGSLGRQTVPQRRSGRLALRLGIDSHDAFRAARPTIRTGRAGQMHHRDRESCSSRRQPGENAGAG
jgi:hypothetical protein